MWQWVWFRVWVAWGDGREGAEEGGVGWGGEAEEGVRGRMVGVRGGCKLLVGSLLCGLAWADYRSVPIILLSDLQALSPGEMEKIRRAQSRFRSGESARHLAEHGSGTLSCKPADATQITAEYRSMQMFGKRVAADRMAVLRVSHGSVHEADHRDGLGQSARTCPPDLL